MQEKHTRSRSQIHTYTCRLKIAAALPFDTLSCWGTHPLPRWSPARCCWSVPSSSQVNLPQEMSGAPVVDRIFILYDIIYIYRIFMSIKRTIKPECALPLSCQEKRTIYITSGLNHVSKYLIFPQAADAQSSYLARMDILSSRFTRSNKDIFLRKGADCAHHTIADKMWILSVWGTSWIWKALLHVLTM